MGEPVGWRRWAGASIGLLDVAIALRPPRRRRSAAARHGDAFRCIQILTRALAALDDPRTTILHTGFAATLATSLVQTFVWTVPSAGDWLLLASLGLLGGAGHGLLVLAFARAPASLLAPLTYTQLVWATLAGVLVFGDWPDAASLAGAAVIALGGVLVALPDRSRR